jgi:hypothetical protein
MSLSSSAEKLHLTKPTTAALSPERARALVLLCLYRRLEQIYPQSAEAQEILVLIDLISRHRALAPASRS